MVLRPTVADLDKGHSHQPDSIWGLFLLLFSDPTSCFFQGPASLIPPSCLLKPCLSLNPNVLKHPYYKTISPPGHARPPSFPATLLQRVAYMSHFFLTLHVCLHFSEAFDSSCFFVPNNQLFIKAQRLYILNISHFHCLVWMSMTLVLILFFFFFRKLQ